MVRNIKAPNSTKYADRHKEMICFPAFLHILRDIVIYILILPFYSKKLPNSLFVRILLTFMLHFYIQTTMFCGKISVQNGITKKNKTFVSPLPFLFFQNNLFRIHPTRNHFHYCIVIITVRLTRSVGSVAGFITTKRDAKPKFRIKAPHFEYTPYI